MEENILTDKQLRYMEWTVEVPDSADYTIISKTFLFQDRNCNLEFYTGHSEVAFPHLTFKCDGELQWPTTVKVTVVSNTEILARRRTSITSEDEKIWIYTDDNWLYNCCLTFELIIDVDCSSVAADTSSTISSESDVCKDKQKPSYMNADVSFGSLTEDFSKLFQTEMDHDVEMKCAGHSLKTHKLVLSARSDVFRAMLKADFLEGQTKIIEIQDMDVNCFKDFVRYLYTDIMPELTFESAKVFYEAGDKYAISSLMLRCADYLRDNLSPVNAFECYALADAHSDQKLKDGIISYLLDKKIYVQEEYWLPFYENFPKVALEVYRLSYKRNKEEENQKDTSHFSDDSDF